MTYHLLGIVSFIAGIIIFMVIKKVLKTLANIFPKQLGFFSSSEDVIYIFLKNKNKHQLQSLINNYSFWNKISFYIIEFGALIVAILFFIIIYLLSNLYIGYLILITGFITILLTGIYNNFVRINAQETFNKHFDSHSFKIKNKAGQ